MLAVYFCWNVRWLAAGRIPPSMFTSATGFPSPTTGGTRSALALLDGDLATSLYYNPMTLPIAGLLTITIAQVLFRGRGENWLVNAWVVTLGIAWIAKLLSPPTTW